MIPQCPSLLMVQFSNLSAISYTIERNINPFSQLTGLFSGKERNQEGNFLALWGIVKYKVFRASPCTPKKALPRTPLGAYSGPKPIAGFGNDLGSLQLCLRHNAIFNHIVPMEGRKFSDKCFGGSLNFFPIIWGAYTNLVFFVRIFPSFTPRF